MPYKLDLKCPKCGTEKVWVSTDTDKGYRKCLSCNPCREGYEYDMITKRIIPLKRR